jgi:hypothetical protein
MRTRPAGGLGLDRSSRSCLPPLPRRCLSAPLSGAGPVALAWPRCAALFAPAPSHGPRITAIYLWTYEAAHGMTVAIDAFVAGIQGRSTLGRLCYKPHHCRNRARLHRHRHYARPLSGRQRVVASLPHACERALPGHQQQLAGTRSVLLVRGVGPVGTPPSRVSARASSTSLVDR